MGINEDESGEKQLWAGVLVGSLLRVGACARCGRDGRLYVDETDGGDVFVCSSCKRQTHHTHQDRERERPAQALEFAD